MKTHTNRISRVLLSLFMLAALTLGAATPIASVHAAGKTTLHSKTNGDLVPVQPFMLNTDGTLNLSSGLNGTLDMSGWDVTLDSKRGPVFSPTALSPNTWSALTDNGLIGSDLYGVNALAVVGKDLYVGGYFTQTSGGATTGLNSIAKYNTLTDTWSALTDNGLNSSVHAFAVIENDLYVGGVFSQTYDGATTGLNGIAKYDTHTNTWSPLTDNGLYAVFALAVIGKDLYLGGNFYQTYGGATTNLNNIAKYNTLTNAWSALKEEDASNNYAVYALTVVRNDLYVGGWFNRATGGETTDLNNIARYNTLTNTWSALADNGLNYPVYTLAAIRNDLYVGGWGFSKTFGGATTGLNNIAKYNTLTNTWSALADNGLDHPVWTLTVIGNELFVGGFFTGTFSGATTDLNYIARYNTLTKTWTAFPDIGLNSHVFSLAVLGSNLYVGGNFTQTASGATTGLSSIARYTLPDIPPPPSDPIFTDVPFTHWANSWVETLYKAHVTDGCDNSPMMYCPDDTVTRAEMAIFILRSKYNTFNFSYMPPPATGTVFADVPLPSFAGAWIEELALEGITTGCGDGNYCPDTSITRAEIAVFLLRGKYGGDYIPPAATGAVFSDVPLESFADAWIEQLANEGIANGCGNNNFCPDSPVTRAEMAVFLVKVFNLP